MYRFPEVLRISYNVDGRIIGEEPLTSFLTTRYLVHGSTNLAWKVDEVEYSDCLLDWVKDDRVKFIKEDLTGGEKRFFCLWDLPRVHMTSLLDRFVEEIGR